MAYQINPELMNGLIADLVRHQGFRSQPYKDSEGHWTIGYGTKLPLRPNQVQAIGADSQRPRSISQPFAMHLLRFRLNENFDKAGSLLSQRYGIDVNQMPPNVQSVIANMAYQLGPDGVADFQEMMKSVAEGDYRMAAHHALQSRWATQTPLRAQEMSMRLTQGLPAETHDAQLPQSPPEQRPPQPPLQDPFRVGRPGQGPFPSQVEEKSLTAATPFVPRPQPVPPVRSEDPVGSTTGKRPMTFPNQGPPGTGASPVVAPPRTVQQEPAPEAPEQDAIQRPAYEQQKGDAIPLSEGEDAKTRRWVDKFLDSAAEKAPEALFAGIAGYLDSRRQRKEAKEHRKRMKYKRAFKPNSKNSGIGV